MDDLAKITARILRRRETPAEKIFWKHVRNRRFENKKFLRQHPIVFDYYGVKRFFIGDFYCAQCKLIIELDGGVHALQSDYDELRDYIISKLGKKVVRFKNEEIEQDLERVLAKLNSFIARNP